MTDKPQTTLEAIIDRFAEVLATTPVGFDVVHINEAKKGQLKSLLRQFAEAIFRVARQEYSKQNKPTLRGEAHPNTPKD